MNAVTYTVAFNGIEAQRVEVQCAVSAGLPCFTIVGLPDKSVSEARERIRSALSALSIALPPKRITINLSPANLPKEGSHYDLPMTLALLAALELVKAEDMQATLSLGELSLDGRLRPIRGALPASLTAAEHDLVLFCPHENGPEAAWVEATRVIAPKNLSQLLRHILGQSLINNAQKGEVLSECDTVDFNDVIGQERAKRAMEIAAAGRHHLFMLGPPGSGKSMLAARMPSILPSLSPTQALETSMIKSLCGVLDNGGLRQNQPFREPHHTASQAAIVGGGRFAKPGEISLAHHGVLFLDELPEFNKNVLETLRQPLETGEVTIARASAHIQYPCKFMLLAAANPCSCGYATSTSRACSCKDGGMSRYLSRISGPLMDRFDLRVDVQAVPHNKLSKQTPQVSSKDIQARVFAARARQTERFEGYDGIDTNADADGKLLSDIAATDTQGQTLLYESAKRFDLSARGYHRILRVARTIADLEDNDQVEYPHIAEAISFRILRSSHSQSATSPAKVALRA